MRLSFSFRPSQSLSFSACWRIGTSYDTTIHFIVALFSTAAPFRHAFTAFLAIGQTIEERPIVHQSVDTPDSIVAHREIFCHRFAVVTAPSCPFLETRSLSLPTFLLGCFSTTSRPTWSGLVSPGFTCLILGQWQYSNQRLLLLALNV